MSTIPFEELYYRFLGTRQCKSLLAMHALSENGLWLIFGEPPSPDKREPMRDGLYLGLLAGQLEEVIRYAVTMRGFYQWGNGGTIQKAAITKVGHTPHGSNVPDVLSVNGVKYVDFSAIEKMLKRLKENIQ